MDVCLNKRDKFKFQYRCCALKYHICFSHDANLTQRGGLKYVKDILPGDVGGYKGGDLKHHLCRFIK